MAIRKENIGGAAHRIHRIGIAPACDAMAGRHAVHGGYVGGIRPESTEFRPLVPNDETIEAIEAARRGELVTVGDVKALMDDLNADDQA